MNKAKKNHQYELDLLRIIGAVNIVLFHYTFRGYAADNMSKLYFPVMGNIFKYGYFSVYIFFILSGYMIILSSTNKSFSNFIYTRLLRLYPTFWISVCFTTLAAIFFRSNQYHVGLKQFIVNLSMLNDYVGISPVDGAYWFIFIILRFYLLISLMLLFKVIKIHKYIAGLWLLFSLVIILFDIPKIGGLIMPTYAPFFVSGMIFCAAKKEGWDIYKYAVQFFALLFSLYIVNIQSEGLSSHYSTEFSKYFVSFIIIAIFLYMYLSTITKKHIVLPKIIITLSACTYPLYLIHQHVGFMIFNNFGEFSNKYVLLLATFAFMSITSVLIVKYIEPYLYNLIFRIVPHQRINKKYKV